MQRQAEGHSQGPLAGPGLSKNRGLPVTSTSTPPQQPLNPTEEGQSGGCGEAHHSWAYCSTHLGFDHLLECVSLFLKNFNIKLLER